MLAAVVQMCSTSNVAHNARLACSVIRRAAAASASLVYLPEAADFICAEAKDVSRLSVALDESEFVRAVRRQAKESGIWVGVGVHEKATAERCYNTNLLIDNQGDIVQAYRKLHLFDVDIKGGMTILESKTTVRGDKLLEPCPTPIGKIGLLTCYDLRFPEVSLSLRRQGAEILTYPSAFTLRTEVLLRARAIETQSYVLAPAQVRKTSRRYAPLSGSHPPPRSANLPCVDFVALLVSPCVSFSSPALSQIGTHAPGRQSYGHALVVDPWGGILAQASDRPPKDGGAGEDEDAAQFVLAEIDLEWLESLRREMPLWNQRRSDVYPIL
ncbi:SPOSA6832_00113 [Sporobolomyces salmonicolor]|uniref:SPOSA6832_00113-mRNA-1:cds n=1 Tax=Sporidiobolus salmonicolor TaxID=5005 RepID=A0A0D6EGJ5_SPOSA|nr:SPOSA6832_00113 [Sporobolomyces salmonicolor]